MLLQFIGALLLVFFVLTPNALAEYNQQIAGGGIQGQYHKPEYVMQSLVYGGGYLYASTGKQVLRYDGLGNWDQINTDCFGDDDNTGIYSLAYYSGSLFAGTRNDYGCEVWRYDGPGPGDWTQVNSDGFGTPYNAAAWTLSVHDGYLYAGTMNSYTGCEVWVYSGGSAWSQFNADGFGDPYNTLVNSMISFNGKLYAGTSRGLTGCQVWRYDGPDPEDWTQVNDNGFGDSNNDAVWSMGTDGTSIFAGTHNGATGAEVYRSVSGTSWTQVNSDAFGDSENVTAASMCFDGSKLYVGAYNYDNGCEVWRYDGDFSWLQVNSDGFGDANMEWPRAMATDGSALWVGADVGLGFSTLPCQLWKYNGSDWSKGSSDGFSPNSNYRAQAMADYGGFLYVGTGAWTGCEVWRYSYAGETWERVGAGGLGDIYNKGVMAMAVYGTKLYVGTRNEGYGCEVWSFDGTSWVQVNTNGFGDVNNLYAQSMAVIGSYLYVGTRNDDYGCEVWRYDGSSWDMVNTNGFGDTKNYQAGSMCVLDSTLYVGTYQPGDGATGCEVWRYDGPDPANWTQVNTNGFGSAQNTGALAATIYDSNMYFGTWRSNATGAQVWRYDGGSAWTGVETLGFGDSNNRGISSLATCNGTLYSGTYNPATGTEVWAYANGEWRQANNDGFGEVNNDYVGCMSGPGTYLYCGTSNLTDGCSIYELYSGIDTVEPGRMARNAAGDIEITGNGTNFLDEVSTVTFTPPEGITINDLSVTDQNRATVNITVSPTAETGSREINVITGDQTPVPLEFQITDVPPQVLGISPNSGVNTGMVNTTVTGNNFNTGADVTLVNGETEIDSQDEFVETSQKITCSFDISGAPPGSYDVVVTNPDASGRLENGFTITLPPPSITSITPDSAEQGEVVNVTDLKGAGFNGVTAVKLQKPGTGEITATNVNLVSANKITCTFNIPANAQPGTWNIYVQNQDGQVAIKSNAFTINASAPHIDSVSPPSGPPGTVVTITGHNFGANRGSGGTSGGAPSYVSFNGVSAAEYESWSDTRIVCTVPAGASAGPVVVVVNGVSSNDNEDFTTAFPNWYLAEGTTAWGFNCYISIQNPNNAAVSVNVTYNTEGGAVSGGTINLPAMSQTTVNPADKLGQKDFSTLVTAPNGETIAVDRTMQWTGGGAGVGAGSSPEAHNSIGVTSPAKTWYLPEGSTSWGFETWLLIQNPNASEATCSVTYMIEGADPVTLEKKVPANSRKSYNMASDIGEKDASIKVTSSVPVIPERAMYRNNRREGHDSIGTTSPATDFYLAEGAVGYDSGYITYVLVQNPQNEPNKVTVTYLTGSGEVAGPTIDMAPNSRKTIRVNDQLPPATDVSTRVHGEKPVIAERAMYWNSPAGEACHDSIGMDSAHKSFYLPDGQTSEGRETWTLVSNPNQIPVEVRISYLPAGGGATITFTDILLPNSRKSYNMADKLPSGRASIMVESIMGGPVMCERAMYWNSRGAGTDTIGGYSD